MNMDTVPNYIQHIQAGKVRAVLNTSNSRYPLLPDVPSTADVKGLTFNAASVLSLWAPKSTPDTIVRKMSSEIAALAKRPEFRSKFRNATNVDPVGSSPEELLSSVQADAAMYSQVAKQISYVPQ